MKMVSNIKRTSENHHTFRHFNISLFISYKFRWLLSNESIFLFTGEFIDNMSLAMI